MQAGHSHQILVSKYYSPIKGTQDPWRNSQLQGWAGKMQDEPEASCGVREQGNAFQMLGASLFLVLLFKGGERRTSGST